MSSKLVEPFFKLCGQSGQKSVLGTQHESLTGDNGITDAM